MLRKNLFVIGLAILGLIFATTQGYSQWRIKTLSWNIESRDSDPAWVQSHLAAMEGYDIVALTEVSPSSAQNLRNAIEHGEGAKGDWQANFSYALSETGGTEARMMICWDNKRFEQVAQPIELDNLNDSFLSHRSPLYVQLRNRSNNESFIVMVNHLARGNEDLRQSQATGLVSWVAEQTLPVIALGDYNFDFDIDEGIGNPAFDIMNTSESWTWLRPKKLIKSQASFSYQSILDFVFVANIPENWDSESEIIRLSENTFDDNEEISDHRPVEAVFYVNPVASVPVTP